MINYQPETICLVAILKDEGMFLDEWLVYHKMLGIDHFFLYDDDPKLPLKKSLIPHSKYISIIEWQENEKPVIRQGNQLKAYKNAWENHINIFEWVVFLDADEFIVLKQHNDIKTFLKDFQHANSVSLNWHLFGHNGFVDDPERLITVSLTRRMKNPSHEVKTISRTHAIASINSPHFCNLKSGIRVDANNQIYSDEMYEGKSEIAHINHYQCRSYNNWMKRIERGNVNYNPKYCLAQHRWRFDKDLCHERFITNIARDKNEHVDNYMHKFKYEIYENILKLNRSKVSSLQNIMNDEFRSQIVHQLELIAHCIKMNIDCLNEIGLFNGKIGVGIFLFQYSRFSNNSLYNELASHLIDSIAYDINKNSSLNYANGLAGYGSSIEYLVKEGFIKENTNKVLEDVDILLHYSLVSSHIKGFDLYYGISGIGRYYISRLKNPYNDPYDERENKNKEILNELIDMLPDPLDIKDDILNITDFLSDAFIYCQNKSKVKNYVDNMVSKIESLLLDDKFEPALAKLNPIHALVTLKKASENLKDKNYINKMTEIIHKYKFNNKPFLLNQVNENNLLVYILLLKYNDFIPCDSVIPLLKDIVKKSKDCMIRMQETKICAKDIDILNGLSGIGLILLAAINENNNSFMRNNFII